MTTNSTKISHLRYLARNYDLDIYSFHERTFLASYSEPRINNRDELLEKSYESAISQWKKAGLSEEALFFLEDTSIIIDALSEHDEYPGLEAKYWMRSTSFEDLDRDLKSRGNNRRVSVRSDIVLHIPPSIRIAKGITRSYLQFTGISSGRVVDEDVDLEGNILYPWQDSKSFNKWFVPNGESAPFSSLPISVANKHDFRRLSFDKMIDYLLSVGLRLREVKDSYRQIPLPAIDQPPPLFIICGLSCAGKTTLAQFLVAKKGYMHFEASDFMRIAYYERLGRDSVTALSKFAAKVLEEEPSVVPEKISKYLERFDRAPVVITGFRSPREVESLISMYNGVSPLKFVYVDAPRRVRFDRAISRSRSDCPASVADMRLRDDEQLAMGLSAIRKSGQFVRISNSSSVEELTLMFEAMFFDGEEPWLAPDDMKVVGFTPLDEAVVLAMGDAGESKGFTTTEIARLINSGERRSFTTAKDNISRYFNQRFHVFFGFNKERGKSRYFLSQTGISLYKQFRKKKQSDYERAHPTKRQGQQFELF